MNRRIQTAVILVSALLVVGGVTALVPNGSATASVTADTQARETVIEGASTAPPSDVIVSASGTYAYDNLPSEAERLEVRLASNAGAVDGGSTIATYSRDLSGTSGSGTFVNVSGDVTDTAPDTGWNEEEFTAHNEGETREQTINVTVETTVITADGERYDHAEGHTVTVRITHLPSENGSDEATVNATTEVTGSVVFADGSTAPMDRAHCEDGICGLPVPTATASN